MLTGGNFEVHESFEEHGNTPIGMIQIAPKAMQTYLGALPESDGMRLYRCATAADGSCFFHSVAAALNINDWHKCSNEERVKTGRRLRRKVRSMLTSKSWRSFWKKRLEEDGLGHKLPTIPTAESIGDKLENPKVWADVWLISWCMRQLDISVIFFDQQVGSRMYCGVRGEPSAQTNILIGWIDHVHFEPIFLYHVGDRQMETAFDKDHALVRHMHTLYDKDQCPDAKIAIT